LYHSFNDAPAEVRNWVVINADKAKAFFTIYFGVSQYFTSGVQ